MTWMRFGFMTAVKVTDNGLEYQFGRNSRGETDGAVFVARLAPMAA
jgi:hypothetical protein